LKLYDAFIDVRDGEVGNEGSGVTKSQMSSGDGIPK